MKTVVTLFIFGLLLVTSSCKKKQMPGFTASKTEIYVGEVVHFFDNEEKRKNCTFTYDFGDGTSSADGGTGYIYGGGDYGGNSNVVYSDRNPSHVYLVPGTYVVTQTMSIAGNLEKGKSLQKTSQLTITVLPLVPDFTQSATTALTTDVVTFINTTPNSGNLSWYGGGAGWTFANTTDPAQSMSYSASFAGGGGSGSNAQEAYVTFNAPGVWKVTLQVGGSLYSNTTIKTVTVN